MGQWGSEQGPKQLDVPLQQEGRRKPNVPAYIWADLQIKVYQADMEMCWGHWAVLVSKPMLTAVQRWTKTESTADVSDCTWLSLITRMMEKVNFKPSTNTGLLGGNSKAQISQGPQHQESMGRTALLKCGVKFSRYLPKSWGHSHVQL